MKIYDAKVRKMGHVDSCGDIKIVFDETKSLSPKMIYASNANAAARWKKGLPSKNFEKLNCGRSTYAEKST